MAMLSQQLAASEASYAILRSSATNQDGRSSSLTAPNGPSQTALIQSALRNAGKPSPLHPNLPPEQESHDDCYVGTARPNC